MLRLTMLKKITSALLLGFITLIPACRQNVRTELLEAARNGQSERVQSLLDAGADVNTQAPDGFTALKWAVIRGHTDTVQVLVNAGADVNIRDNLGQSALMLALEEDETQIVELPNKQERNKRPFLMPLAAANEWGPTGNLQSNVPSQL